MRAAQSVFLTCGSAQQFAVIVLLRIRTKSIRRSASSRRLPSRAFQLELRTSKARTDRALDCIINGFGRREYIDAHWAFFKFRWSAGSTSTTRSRSFLTTASLLRSKDSLTAASLPSVSLSTALCALCASPACCGRMSGTDARIGGRGARRPRTRKTRRPSRSCTRRSPLRPRRARPSDAPRDLRGAA
jgi:hypothetical protein